MYAACLACRAFNVTLCSKRGVEIWAGQSAPHALILSQEHADDATQTHLLIHDGATHLRRR
jgi:hypothetical protein